ncbi:hypothetical protein, partial [Streptomyces brasiliscabiei]|uniref:hypothetical protein n=1 Tax=Streptomyces brasiliscabiei TaxID=2736302 RepID=UPI003014CC8E
QREIAPPDDATEERSSYSHDLSKNRLRRIVGWSLAVIAFVILGSGVWLVFRAIVVKNELEAAQILVRDVDDASPADMG